MRWGYAWDLGPFETWDLLGIAETTKRLEAEDRALPPPVRAVLERGEKTFYRSVDGQRQYFDLAAARYRPAGEPAGGLVVVAAQSHHRGVAATPRARPVRLGEGIACP